MMGNVHLPPAGVKGSLAQEAQRGLSHSASQPIMQRRMQSQMIGHPSY